MIDMVVIVVCLATLITLCIPVILASQARAQRVHCASNLLNNSSAYFFSYANDHDGAFNENKQYLPTHLAAEDGRSSDIRDTILEYVGSSESFYCPQSGLQAPDDKSFSKMGKDGLYYQSYLLLGGLSDEPFGHISYLDSTETDFASPQKMSAERDKVIAADLSYRKEAFGLEQSWQTHRAGGEAQSGSNVLMMDGSVNWRLQADMSIQLLRKNSASPRKDIYYLW